MKNSEVFEEDLDAVLTRLQRAIFRHPLAVQAAFACLVSEGRKYAETPEGRILAHRLAGSELMARTRTVWEAVSLGVFKEDEAAIPESLFEALTQLLAREGLEPLIAAWFERRAERSDDVG